MLVKNLKVNVKNPRKISASKKAALKETMAEFGDLGGITYNVKFDRLVTGHQRVSQMDRNAKVVYEAKHDTPTIQGTIAEGYIEVGGEKFRYREVEWDEDKETRALLAANKSGGEFDPELLRVNLASLKFDIKNTGFEIPDLKSLNIDIESVKVPVIKESASVDNSVDGRFDRDDEESDESYVRNTPETLEQIPTENPNLNVFEKVEEKKMDVVSRRFVIIIDCTSNEHKEALKDKIRPLVTEAGGKFF